MSVLKDGYDTEERFVRPIFDLAFILKNSGVPYVDCKWYDGWRIWFPWCIGDVVCFYASYSSEDGRVESIEFPWDKGDVSTDTPENMARKIIDYYNSGNFATSTD